MGDPSVHRRPAFGVDGSTVSGFTPPGYEVYLRVLAPFEAVGDTEQMTWAAVATWRGEILQADASCWDLGLARSSDGSGGLLPAYGFWSSQHVGLLIDALATTTDRAEPCTWVIWDGYAGDSRPLNPAPRRTEFDLHSWMTPESCHEVQQPLSWLLTRSREAGNHIPLAGWPNSLELVLAAPIDHDSLYVACNASLANEVVSRLEALRVSREHTVKQGY